MRAGGSSTNFVSFPDDMACVIDLTFFYTLGRGWVGLAYGKSSRADKYSRAQAQRVLRHLSIVSPTFGSQGKGVDKGGAGGA